MVKAPLLYKTGRNSMMSFRFRFGTISYHQSTAFAARSVMDNSSSRDDTQTVRLAGCYDP
jgi:hypothetical protein